MAAGALLVLAGTWVLMQVLGGNALGRLGVTGSPTQPGTKAVGQVAGGSRSGPELPSDAKKPGMGG